MRRDMKIETVFFSYNFKELKIQVAFRTNYLDSQREWMKAFGNKDIQRLNANCQHQGRMNKEIYKDSLFIIPFVHC